MLEILKGILQQKSNQENQTWAYQNLEIKNHSYETCQYRNSATSNISWKMDSARLRHIFYFTYYQQQFELLVERP